MADELKQETSNAETMESISIADFDDVLNLVFRLLPMKDLQLCARVCKKWNSLASSIRRSRQAISWLLYSPQLHSHELTQQITEPLQIMSSEPQTAILFLSSSLYEDHIAVPVTPGTDNSTQRCPRAAKQEKIAFTTYLQRVMPSSCDIVGVVTDGVVGTEWDLQKCYEVENAMSASCLLLPQMDGVKLRHFSTSSQQLENQLPGFFPTIQTPKPNPDGLAAITGIPSDERARLVLLFYTERYMYVEGDLGAALLMHYGNVVVAGGYVDNFIPAASTHGNLPDEEDSILGISFCGGDNIHVASVVIPSTVDKAEEVETILNSLKGSHVCEGSRQCFAFMFACIGRGQYHYRGQTNVEASVFHKLFPGVPLFGFFGNGELGYEYLPDYSKSEGDRNMCLVGDYEDDDCPDSWELPNLHHSYTTIFAILSLT